MIIYTYETKEGTVSRDEYFPVHTKIFLSKFEGAINLKLAADVASSEKKAKSPIDRCMIPWWSVTGYKLINYLS